MIDWQPIETCPDGETVLVAGQWDDGRDWINIGLGDGGCAFGDWDYDLEPTHWMPLPAPPELSPADRTTL